MKKYNENKIKQNLIITVTIFISIGITSSVISYHTNEILNNYHFTASASPINNNIFTEITDEVNLTIAEYEAIRLINYSKLSQKQAARSMRISQQTLSRIVRRANEIIADAIVNGKIIRILQTNAK